MSDVRFPSGFLWPIQMPADMSAAFMGEQSVEAFRTKVKEKIYPPPISVMGQRQMWRKKDLEEHVNGFGPAESLDEDI